MGGIAKMAVEQLNKTDEPEYEAFIQNHSSSVAFEHTLLWREVMSANFGFIPYFLVYKNFNGKIEGILPLFKAKSIFGTRFVSTPYSITTGIIAENKSAQEELVSFAKELCLREKASFVEIRERNEKNYGDYAKISTVFNFSLQLTNNIEEIWKKLPKSSVRWGIKKAQNSGLTWNCGSSHPELDDFFKLFLQTRKHRGVPGYPYDYFRDIINTFGEKVRIYITKKDNKPIAAIFLIYYQKEVRYAFAGATYDKEMLNLQPYHLILWEAIKDACVQDYQVFNFGGATLATNDGGLYEFKRKWGDKVEKVHSYFYYNNQKKSSKLDNGSNNNSSDNNGNNPGNKHGNDKNIVLLKVASKIWQKLPLSVIKKISPYVIKQFV